MALRKKLSSSDIYTGTDSTVTLEKAGPGNGGQPRTRPCALELAEARPAQEVAERVVLPGQAYFRCDRGVGTVILCRTGHREAAEVVDGVGKFVAGHAGNVEVKVGRFSGSRGRAVHTG